MNAQTPPMMRADAIRAVEPDPPTTPDPPVHEPPPAPAPIEEPAPERPGTTPLPGTPTITPQEVPAYPGQPLQPGTQHPADPIPHQPVGQLQLIVVNG
ncbi:MAG: hypothetical protein IPG10_02180 [Flavobacteriales bacterium]|nr:hypothetical protein [Flavobacteriales bacterium]MBK6753000.1 hypothetical protein [Flavobacteriales bacterium]MBK7085737.1 hypothetical protein [Flavobacteriales bacterium]MBK7268371.1 hypothetical protein [Flavobacteriales bacterium]MBK7752795.1 hypothetical protein [Flavobacteriales bacterium]